MRLSQLTEVLRDAHTFEEGARATLEILLSAVAHSPAAQLRPLRGMVHLRPGGSYSSLVVLERDADDAAPDVVPSASAWQALIRDPRPLAVDVLRAQALPLWGAPPTDGPPLLASQSRQSIVRLRARLTTLLLVLPLRGHGGQLLGAASLELGTAEDVPPDRAALATLVEALQALADVLALALPGLPLAAATGLATPDPRLPVVGAEMGRLLRFLGVFARQEETLLLAGETGVGKSQLAAWCHHRSGRPGPLESVVLSTLPEEMQLPSLFGWTRGAFTGAVRDAPGAVARAEGGTLFIDEIDKLSPRAQAGLLQLLESRQFRPIGDPGPLRRADVRFIIGTNIDLAEAVAEGRFLEDLFFRINVLPVRIPALEARRDEIPDWVRFMAGRRHQKADLGVPLTVSDEACALLAASPWPGNLRQLDNTVRRAYAVMLSDAPAGALVLQGRHVAQALEMDLVRPRQATTAGTTATGLLPPLTAAAEALLGQLAQHSPEQREAILSLAEATSTLLLHAALQETGDVKAAYEKLGRAGLVASRSHHKDFRRRMQRLRELMVQLQLPVDEALAASFAI